MADTTTELEPVQSSPIRKPQHARHEPFGRPTLYTHALAQAICDNIAQGMTKRGACGLFEITEETFMEWSLERADFSRMLARAEATAEQIFTRAILTTAQDRNAPADWRPAMEWLKRRRRKEYGDTLDIRTVPVEQLRQLLNLQADDLTEDVPAIAASAEELI